MEKLFKSYADTEFLKELLDQYASIKIDDVTNKPDILRSLYKFLSKNTKITLKHTGISMQSLSYQEKYSFIRFLLNEISGGAKDIESINLIDENKVNRENPLEYSFLFKGEEHIVNNNGIPIISNSNIIEEWGKYYKSNTQIISHKHSAINESMGWKGLIIPKHSCNALLFADTYFFGDKRNITSNFKPILAQILPKSRINVQFDFTIFAHLLYPAYNYQTGKHLPANLDVIQTFYDDIKSILKKDFDLNQINLSVIHMGQRDFHERCLLTNSFAFNSGNAFSYYDNTGKSKLPSQTILNINPLPAENNNLTYAHTYLTLLSNLEQISTRSNLAIGSRQNRLFKQFKNPEV